MGTVVSVKHFGAFGDGVHDDYAAVQKALDSGAGTVIIPAGVYNVSKTLKIHSNTVVEADFSAKIIMKSSERRRRGEFLLTNSDIENGNSVIEINGGVWDGNKTAEENAKADIFDKNGYSGSVINFFNVNGLTLKNMVIANSAAYNVRMSKICNFNIENISFVSDTFTPNQDGLHFCGDVKHGTVRNIRALSYGQTNDDLIALNADDSVERVENLDLLRDDIEDITIENIYAENCHTLVRLLSVTAAIRNIRIKNVFGGFRCNAINAGGGRRCKVPCFDEKDFPQGVGRIENVTIENFICYPCFTNSRDRSGSEYNPNYAFQLESNADNFTITDFKMIVPDGRENSVAAFTAGLITNEKILADGREYLLKEKSDSLTLDKFSEMKISRE